MFDISNSGVYLSRLAKPLSEKLKVAKFIPKESTNILDVGCADGTLTIHFGQMFGEAKILGIDLNNDFIKIANSRHDSPDNVFFEKIYLRELLARKGKFDAIIFCSVLHEFFTYGEGITSVVKALADAVELLKPNGKIIIREMILSEKSKTENNIVGLVLNKIGKTNVSQQLADFEGIFGKIENIYQLNHFLLKYRYLDNWEREVKENYVPVTIEQFELLFQILGLKIEYKESYLIPFIKKTLKEDFGLNGKELSPLYSTTILVGRKIV